MNKEMSKVKKIEDKYRQMSQREHILLRSGMYIGSVKNEQTDLFLYDVEESLMKKCSVDCCPGLLKLCDEVISNSCDEFRREGNMGLTEIVVKIDNNGSFSVRDNGGIPVVMHKVANMMLPDFLFSQLRTSSNYDDTESRDVVGTNGIGACLTGIFSSYFSIFTADGKHSYFHSWSDNMGKDNGDAVKKNCKDHFTESSYIFDLSRFENITSISDEFVDVVEKRCIDAAAANLGLTVKFEHYRNGFCEYASEWKFSRFEEYIMLYSNYIDDADSLITYSDDMKSVWFFPDGNINIGFVNGAECSSGTHIRAIHKYINESVSSYINTKKKISLVPKDIDGKYSIFCLMHVDNPAYDSQTKDTLTTPVSKFKISDSNYEFTMSKKFLDSVNKTDLIDTVMDWYRQKTEVEDLKNIRKLNKDSKKKISRGDKFIDANSKNRAERELWIFEGDSANAGFRMARNPQTQAAYLLRGCPYNTISSSASKIMQNKELSDLVSIIGLQWGCKNKKEDLNFSRIVIATDADYDGSHICGLLLVFFNRFPELFEYGMVCRSISPIMVAYNDKESINIYTYKEYKQREKELKNYNIKYAKGLGSLNNQQYKEMMQNPMFHYYKKDELSDQSINRWFGKGIAKDRRDVLKHEV